MSNITGTEWMSGDTHIVMGGSESLPGAPDSWNDAEAWSNKANETSLLEWTWDCHMKLDYDGAFVSISSRFYPPAKHYGPNWDGKCSLMFGEETITEKKFECSTLDELKKQVDTYVQHLHEQVATKLIHIVN